MVESCAKNQYSSRSDEKRRARWARVVVALGLTVSAAGALAASETLYYFVDDRGIPHFSNVPADKRYRPFARVSVAPQAPAQTIDDGGYPLPYEEEHAPADETVQVEISQEPLPVQMQEH